LVTDEGGAMDVPLFRDWVIIVWGIINILVLIGILVMVILLLFQIKRLLNKIRNLTDKVEYIIENPVNAVVTWLFGGNPFKKPKHSQMQK
jgi:hypothetical protein